MQAKKYDEDFKKSIVTLCENGKTQSELSREYGVSLSYQQVGSSLFQS